MRVHYLINGLGAGGAERSLAEMLLAFPAHLLDASVTCLYDAEQGVERPIRDAGFRVRVLPGNGYLSRVRALHNILKTESYDLTHSTLEEANLIARVAGGSRLGVLLNSLVNTTYTPERRRDPNVRMSRLAMFRILDGWTARHLTTHFHAISHSVKEAAVASLGIPVDRITVIERGRDPQRMGTLTNDRRARARIALGLRQDDEIVVTVGRQEFQKGQRHLIGAVTELARRRPRLILLIAGRQGHATALLEDLVAHNGVASKVRFLGHRDDVPEVLSAGDVFAFPSLYEGLGGAVLEAMALGLPIVASDIPAMREVLEANGNAKLVPLANESALARAIEQLLEDRVLARRYGARGKAIFDDRFRLDRSVDRMLDLYERLATKGADASAIGRAAGQ